MVHMDITFHQHHTVRRGYGLQDVWRLKTENVFTKLARNGHGGRGKEHTNPSDLMALSAGPCPGKLKKMCITHFIKGAILQRLAYKIPFTLLKTTSHTIRHGVIGQSNASNAFDKVIWQQIVTQIVYRTRRYCFLYGFIYGYH